jgi:engulfment and cell motility protein 1
MRLVGVSRLLPLRTEISIIF